MRFGTWEIVAILAVILIIFGPKRLPQLGKSVGEFFKNFKKGTKEIKEEAKQIQDQVKI